MRKEDKQIYSLIGFLALIGLSGFFAFLVTILLHALNYYSNLNLAIILFILSSICIVSAIALDFKDSKYQENHPKTADAADN